MQEVLVSKIFNYTSTPTKNVEGQFWFNPSTNVLSRFNGTVWKPITVSSDDVAVLTDGSKVSLTSYLNTQIAALAEGIDSKQDKLETYKEKQGERQNSTTISSSVYNDEVNGPISGEIIIHTNGLDDAGGTPHSGSIILSTGNSIGGGGDIILAAGDSEGTAGASLEVCSGSKNGHITLSAGETSSTNITLEAASGNLEFNVAKITGSAVDTTIGSSSTDNHIPTSKAVYDALELKQDKLLYYSETLGDAPSATISVANIKLGGSVAEGMSTTASGSYSHTEGANTTASGNLSHTEGLGTTASSDYQHVQGKFNIEDADNKYADIIGNGPEYDERSNAATVSWEGITWSKTDVRAGGTDQDSAAHSLSAKQNATDNSLTTTNKTIVGAINELSSDKQNTLQFYTESITNASGAPAPELYQEQISLGKSNYGQTINIGGNNFIQRINLGGGGVHSIITIGGTTSNNEIQIGRTDAFTALEINANTINGNIIDKTALTEGSYNLPTSQAVLNGLLSKQNSTDNNLTTTDKTIVGAINELNSEVATNTTNIRTLQTSLAGTLYFDNAKLFGSNFAIPNFPFSICATVRVDSWEGSTQGIQTIFQFGNNGTGALWGAISFTNVIDNPNIRLRISKNTDGTISYSEVTYFFDKDTFLGKEHTIVGVCRELESTPVNFDIYVDGTKVATSPYKGLTLDSLSGTVNYAVHTYNANYSTQPASAHSMMLRNLYVFNFDVSAEGSPYSIADYEAGRLIPPALKPSQVSLALENYTIARNATTKLVKDASGNSNDATVQGSGTVAGDNDQSIKAFVDEIKTQINQSNG